MKILLDEHITPRVASAVQSLTNAERRGWEIESIRGSSYQSTEDEHWVQLFAKSGGNAFVSADRRMLKRESFLIELHSTALTAVFLPRYWQQQRLHLQAAFILRYWDYIVERADNGEAGSCFKLPSAWHSEKFQKFNFDAGKFEEDGT